MASSEQRYLIDCWLLIKRPVEALMRGLSVFKCFGRSLSCLGTEALARLSLSLGGFQLMLQSSQFDGVAFDPFSFQKDGLASAEVDVGRR